MSKLLAALLLLVSTASSALTLDPVMRCDGPIVVFDMSILEAKGNHQPVASDFVMRLRQFAARVCGPDTEVKAIQRPGALLSDIEPDIVLTLDREPPAVAIVHAPYADIEAGVPPPALLERYRRILGTCDRARATCIVVGQQPLEALSAQGTARQVALEQAADREFTRNYLPIHRHFRSELASRNLMKRLDIGDGRALSERGHLLLFNLLRSRLIALSAPMPR